MIISVKEDYLGFNLRWNTVFVIIFANCVKNIQFLVYFLIERLHHIAYLFIKEADISLEQDHTTNVAKAII